MGRLKVIWNRLKWSVQKKDFFTVGVNTHVGNNFKFIGAKYISIGNNFSAGEKLLMQAWDSYLGEKTGMVPAINIGNDVSVMDNCHISCINKVTIGNGVLLGDNVFITDNYHGTGKVDESCNPPIERKLYSKGTVEIGDNVWIGRNVCIMPNVKIGNGAIIGANAVVTQNVPLNAVAGGVPAKIIKIQE